MNKADDLRLWRYFVLLADRKYLSEVAFEAGVELSTISRAISQLEKSVGKALIKRNTRPVELTDFGSSVLPKIRKILELQDSLLDEIKDDNTALKGEIRLSVSPGFAASKLPFYLAEFNKIYPNLSFRITPGKSVDDLLRGECDITIATGEVKSTNVIKLYRGHNIYLPVASPDYLKKHPKPLNPEDLKDHTVYLYNGPIRPPTSFLAKDFKFEPVVGRNLIHFPSIQAVRKAAIAGLGVAVDLTTNKCLEDILEERLVPILPGWFRSPLPVYTVISRSAWMLRRVRVFSQWFNERTAEANRQEMSKLKRFYLEKYGIATPEFKQADQSHR